MRIIDRGRNFVVINILKQFKWNQRWWFMSILPDQFAIGLVLCPVIPFSLCINVYSGKYFFDSFSLIVTNRLEFIPFIPRANSFEHQQHYRVWNAYSLISFGRESHIQPLSVKRQTPSCWETLILLNMFVWTHPSNESFSSWIKLWVDYL